MKASEVIGNIGNSDCLIHECNFKMEVDKFRQHMGEPLQLIIRLHNTIDLGFADRATQIRTKMKVVDEPLARYEIILGFMIVAEYKDAIGRDAEVMIKEKNNKILAMELLKLGIPKLESAINVILGWMGIRDKINEDALVKVIDNFKKENIAIN